MHENFSEHIRERTKWNEGVRLQASARTSEDELGEARLGKSFNSFCGKKNIISPQKSLRS